MSLGPRRRLAVSGRAEVRLRLLVVLLLLCLVISTTSTASPPANLGAVFSLANLGEYNQLIDCVSNIRNAFIQCNEEAQKKGERVLKYVDEKSELGQLLKCCGIWLVRDCWTRAAGTKCTREQVAQLEAMPAKFIPGLDRLCEKYPPGSSSCYTPHLILASIFLSAIILLAVILVATVYGWRRYRQHRHHHHHSTGGDKLMTLAVKKNNNEKDIEKEEPAAATMTTTTTAATTPGADKKVASAAKARPTSAEDRTEVPGPRRPSGTKKDRNINYNNNR